MTAAARYELKPRRVRFDHSSAPDHWIPGDPHTTHVANVLHLLLPAGERWFVEVYKKAAPLVEDEALRRDVKAFIGQEATHARAHEAVLDDLLARGIDPRPFTRLADRVAHLARPRQAPAWLPERARRTLDRRYLLAQLAAIAGIEHFTAVMGWWIVASRGLDDAGADPDMLALLRWHGAEEVEHRSVAFDAYQALGGGYVRRCVAMLGIFVGMFGTWMAATQFLLLADPGLRTGRRASVVKFVRAGRRGLLPPTAELVRAVPRYLSPRYHPSHEGRTEVAAEYLASARLVAGAA